MMRNSRYKIASVFCFAFAIALLFMVQPPSDSPQLTSSTIHSPNGRHSFPPRFIFGTASAAYQYEGAANEDGRGPSIWDTFSHTPGKIQDNSNGDVALDHYHRYKEDIQLMKKMGVDAYRFSVSWSRILPDGTVDGGVNKAGVNFYNNVINELISNGIKPYITLYHWDLPQALQDKYKGFLNKQIVEDFKGFAEICFREFGDRVKNWITMNEPWTFTAVGYDFGSHAPGRCSKFIRNCTEGNSAVEPYIVAHHILLAHGAAVSIYREKYQASQKGTIGISLSCHWMMPYSENVDDQKAAQRALDFMFGWFMDPISSGEYPTSMREMVGDRLPEFTEKQAHSLKGSFDFIGLNYYTARYAIHEPNKPDPMWTSSNADTQVKQTAEKNGVSLGVTGASDWLYVFPQGLRDLLLYIKNRYNNPPIFITENGIDEFNKEDISLQQALNDTHRVDYFEKHLDAVKEAISEGANVRGFFAWSLLDNFEWAMGYTVRFGLHYVDFKDNLKRYPKASALWFASFLG